MVFNMMKKLETIEVSGDVAIQELNRLRKDWPTTHLFPFIIGSNEDLEQLLDMIEPPEDNGDSIIQEAMAFDVAGWLKEHAPERKATWPKKTLPPSTGILSVKDVLTQQLKPRMHIGLVEVTTDWHLFARLGYGGWNDCPPPHVQVAVHKYWDEKYKTSPVYVSGDTVELLVRSPAVEKECALTLAAEQYAYCYDIVEQGVGSVGKLASGLLSSKYWYFWWD